MNCEELKDKLGRLGVPPSSYSLNGALLPDTIVMQKYEDSWKVLYFDERGNIHDETFFTNEDEACKYVYFLFEDTIRTFGPFEDSIKAGEKFRASQKDT